MSFKIKRPILNPLDNVIDLFVKLNMIDNPMPDKIIFNPPATIIFKNGKKFVAKCHPDDEFDEEQGLMVALLKSFGIKYKDLQEMLKAAKRPQPKNEIEEVDVEDGKSYNSIGNDRMQDCIANGIMILEDVVSGFRDGKIPPIRENKPVSKPRKIVKGESKPKRPVGRQKKKSNISVGDIVCIKDFKYSKYTSGVVEDMNDMKGKIYIVDGIIENQFDGKIFMQCSFKNSVWYVDIRDLELVKKGDCNDK